MQDGEFSCLSYRPKCKCGLEPTRRKTTSKQNGNEGRVYLKCVRDAQSQGQGCGWFRFEDDLIKHDKRPRHAVHDTGMRSSDLDRDLPHQGGLIRSLTDSQAQAMMVGPPGRVLRVVAAETAIKQRPKKVASPEQRKKRKPESRPGGRQYYNSGVSKKGKRYTCRCGILEYHNGTVVVDQSYWPSNRRGCKEKNVGKRKEPTAPPGVSQVHLCKHTMMKDGETSDYTNEGIYKLKDHLSVRIGGKLYECESSKEVEDQYVIESKLHSDVIDLEDEVFLFCCIAMHNLHHF